MPKKVDKNAISFEQLRSLFHLPISEVSVKLGICDTALKKICRKNGIKRWPYRKIASVHKIMNCLSSNQENVEMKELLKTQLEKKKALLNDDLVNSYIAEKSIEIERQEQMVKEQSGDSNDERYDEDDDDDGVLALIQFSSPSSFFYQHHQPQQQQQTDLSLGLPSMSQKFNSIPIKYTPRPQQFSPFIPQYTTQLQQQPTPQPQFSLQQQQPQQNTSSPQTSVPSSHVVLPSQVLPSIKSEYQKETLLPGVHTIQNPLSFVPNWLESERTKYLNAKQPKKTEFLIETN